MSITAAKPVTTPIPVQLSEPEFVTSRIIWQIFRLLATLRDVTLPIGLQSWTHTFANEPQECPLSAQQGLGVAFIVLCL